MQLAVWSLGPTFARACCDQCAMTEARLRGSHVPSRRRWGVKGGPQHEGALATPLGRNFLFAQADRVGCHRLCEIIALWIQKPHHKHGRLKRLCTDCPVATHNPRRCPVYGPPINARGDPGHRCLPRLHAQLGLINQSHPPAKAPAEGVAREVQATAGQVVYRNALRNQHSAIHPIYMSPARASPAL